MHSRIALTAAAVLLTATAAAAQAPPPPPPPPPSPSQQDKMAVEATAQFARVPLESRIVKDAPYSAETVTEHQQTLPDGNRIARKTVGRVYRDSQGRTRREDVTKSGDVVRISITDPVAGTSISLYPQSRTAWITPFGVAHALVAKMVRESDPGEVERKRKVEQELAKAHAEGVVTHAEGVPPPPPPPPAPPEGYLKTEKLPAKMIEGVMCEGTRTTRTIKAGAIGNDQPIVSVTEEWRSPELQVLVMTRTSDPRTGEDTYQLVNLVRGEQSRSWFEVPSDYTVKETGIKRLMPTMK